MESTVRTSFSGRSTFALWSVDYGIQQATGSAARQPDRVH